MPTSQPNNTGKKTLTRQEMIDAGILKPGPEPVITRRIKLQHRTEKPVNMIPPRITPSFPAYYD